MRGAQTIRQWQLVRLLINTPKGLTVTELAGALKARKRTVYRDLEILREADFPIHGIRSGRSVAWCLRTDEFTEREQEFFRGSRRMQRRHSRRR